MLNLKYLVTVPGKEECEVTKEEWCRYERQAGFHLGHGPDDITKPATGGFSGYNGITGRIVYEGPQA